MSGGRWPAAVDVETWVDTRLQAHHAVQLLASFAGEFLEPRDDDGHRSLCWVDEDAVLATGSAERGDMPVTVTFDPASFRIGVRVAAGTETFDLAGARLEAARDWLGARVGAALGRDPSLAPPEYTIPEHGVGDGAPFDPDAGAATALVDWFSAANTVLAPVAARDDAGPLRCWPHHFDLATLITLPEAEGTPTRTVGAGMTPGDGFLALPYGYVTPYPYPREADRPPLGEGYWHADEWLGAVLPTGRWIGADGPDRVARFFADAVLAATDLLSPP